MRIALISWTNRKVGGLESYVETIIPSLCQAGHDLAFFYEQDLTSAHERIAVSESVETSCAAEVGKENFLATLRGWRPDLLFTQRVLNQELESRLLEIAPSVFFSHDFQRACITGAKTVKAPVSQPCTRAFGWQCLLHYYPRRCGGLNPLTMAREYRRQAQGLSMLRRYGAVVTATEFLCKEFRRYGLNTHCVPYPVPKQPTEREAHANQESSSELRLLFMGRFEHLKGGQILLEALPIVHSVLNQPLRAIFVGDGRARGAWEELAKEITTRTPRVTVQFTGWLEQREHERFFLDCDFLVVPSLWPEPFGIVGLEAGVYGVPAIAFAVGGIPEWLRDGVNGLLVPADPPTAQRLADGIVKCFSNKDALVKMRREAFVVAQSFSVERHLTVLQKVFRAVLSN